MDQSGNYSQEFIHQLNNTPGRSRFNLKQKPKIVWVITGLVSLLVITFIAIAIINNSRPNLSKTINQLIAHTEATKKLSTTYHQKLTSTSLRAANITLQATLTQLVGDATAYSKELSATSNQPSSKSVQPPQLAEVEQRLNVAILNANLDRKFSSEIRYQLNQIAILAQQANRASSSQKFKDNLAKNYTNLQNINDQIKNIQLD